MLTLNLCYDLKKKDPFLYFARQLDWLDSNSANPSSKTNLRI